LPARVLSEGFVCITPNFGKISVRLYYYSWFLFNIAELNQNSVQLIKDQLLVLHNSGSSEIYLPIKNFVCNDHSSNARVRGLIAALWAYGFPPHLPKIHTFLDNKHLKSVLGS
jgi:hypothetical protein